MVKEQSTYTASVVAFSKGPRRTDPGPTFKPEEAKRLVDWRKTQISLINLAQISLH